MKLNEDKCHLMSFGAQGSNETTITIGEARMKESTEEDLLGITFDQSLSFKQHVKALCTKASQNASCSFSNITIPQGGYSLTFNTGGSMPQFRC